MRPTSPTDEIRDGRAGEHMDLKKVTRHGLIFINQLPCRTLPHRCIRFFNLTLQYIPDLGPGTMPNQSRGRDMGLAWWVMTMLPSRVL